MKKERFSYYLPPISNTLPERDLTLEDVWKYISGRSLLDVFRRNPQTGGVIDLGNLQKVTERVRSLSPEEYSDRKTGKGYYLPLVTFGGVFDYRNGDPESLLERKRKDLETETEPKKISSLRGTIKTLEGKRGLQESSGLINLDIDHISSLGLSLEELKDKLSQDREIGLRLIFTSPSGDGLKLVCKTSGKITDRESYRREFETLNSFVSRKYSIPIAKEGLDRGISDITRGCFLCFDSQAILREWEDVFHPESHPIPSESPREDYSDLLRDFDRYNLGDGVEEIVRRVEESGRDLFPEYVDFFSLACSFASLGERGKDLFRRVCNLHTPPPTEEALETEWRKGTDSRYTHTNPGYFINVCKSSGIDVSPHSERPSRDRKKTAQKPGLQTPQETPPEEKYKDFLTIQDLRDIASTKREGIKTGYSFKDSSGKEENLILPSGALTLVCGKSSHGKSRLLQNLSLQIAKEEYNRGGDGVVLYFSFEESLLEVVERFANIAVNIPHLSQFGTSNKEVIRDYLQTGKLNKAVERNRVEALPLLSGFETLYKSGMLRIYYSPELSSGDLCGLLGYLSSQMKIKAVFLDYVQAIYKEGYRKDRREELREICKEINKTAISLDVPIVLSAQLNRETPNPTEMSGDNIAESADITRYANTILLLWDSVKERDIRGGKTIYLNSPEGQRLQAKGFVLGESGKLFAVLSKHRGGTPDIETILDYIPETGKILDNEDLPGGVQTQDSGDMFSL